MMGLRNFVGVAGWLKASPLTPSTTPIISQVGGEFETLSQFGIAARRSAELCLHHLTRKTPRAYQGQQNRNSGQRASSRSCARTSLLVGCQEAETTCMGRSDCFAGRLRLPNCPFQPIRPGLNAEPSGYELRFCVAGKLQVMLTAKGIGVI
jgi:hypothetical protein